MAHYKVRVLIVDDSAMFRRYLSLALTATGRVEVIGTVPGAAEAREFLRIRRPDVIALDLEMPGENGLTFLRDLMRNSPIPTVVISSHTGRGPQVTIEALELGAVDVIAKPMLGPGLTGAAGVGMDLADRLAAAAGARLDVSPPGPLGGQAQTSAAAPRPAPPQAFPPDWMIAIGSSTGGVQALGHLLPSLPANAPAVLVVQHMPEGFTNAFARRLDTLCAMDVREARDGDEPRPGLVLLAPGGLCHMAVVRDGHRLVVRLAEGPQVAFSRPSVDVLFRTLADAQRARISAAILTGMGRDGAEGLLAIRRAGGRTFAQDEASSEIYGMPARAWEAGGAEAQVPLSQMASRLLGSVGKRPSAQKSPPFDGTVPATGPAAPAAAASACPVVSPTAFTASKGT